MPERKRRRTRGPGTALFLYAVLLVLPAVVLGGFLWQQLRLDYKNEKVSLGPRTERASERLREAIANGVAELIRAEEARPFDHFVPYQFSETDDGLIYGVSPLKTAQRPGILGWYSGNGINTASDDISKLQGHFVLGERASESGAAAFKLLVAWLCQQDQFVRLKLLGESRREFVGSLSAHGFWLQQVVTEPSEIRARLEERPARRRQPIEYGRYWLRVVDVEDATDQSSRLFAARQVLFNPPQRAPLDDQTEGEQFEGLASSFVLQGFEIDQRWLFEDLVTASAQRVLAEDQRLLLQHDDAGPTAEPFEIVDLAKLLEITGAEEPSNFGRIWVLTDAQRVDQNFRKRALRFAGVAAIMLISLLTGLWLLISNLRREQRSAETTRNFVAAVTHEFRTPLSTIALHTEMLQEGWATTPQRQRAYFERIASETARLSKLVERVLEKSNLTHASQSAHRTEAVPGDLSKMIEACRPSLLNDGATDLRFDLAQDLPLVRLDQDAIWSIVTNLVENARKYAGAVEPILVRTVRLPKGAALEVLDRGPGIPPEERARIFEAFYRIGNDRMHTTKGTGLGLHLVELQAKSLGGRASVHERDGGGAIFRVELPALKAVQQESGKGSSDSSSA